MQMFVVWPSFINTWWAIIVPASHQLNKQSAYSSCGHFSWVYLRYITVPPLAWHHLTHGRWLEAVKLPQKQSTLFPPRPCLSHHYCALQSISVTPVLGIGVKTFNIKMMILFDTCVTEAWRWSLLNIVYNVHPNLKAVCSTGHIGAYGILLDLGHFPYQSAHWKIIFDMCS